VQEWTAVKQYGDRPQTPYDHAAQIRDLLGYREFSAAGGEVAAFIASRVAKTRDSRRELFDRAVLWLIENRVLLPGISTLSRLVAEVRRRSWPRSTPRWWTRRRRTCAGSWWPR